MRYAGPDRKVTDHGGEEQGAVLTGDEGILRKNRGQLSFQVEKPADCC